MDKTKATQETRPPVMVATRVAPEIRDEIVRRADENFRSVSGELRLMIERYVNEDN